MLPLAVSVAVLPGHIVEDVTAITGDASTLIVFDSGAEEPNPFVAINVIVLVPAVA